MNFKKLFSAFFVAIAGLFLGIAAEFDEDPPARFIVELFEEAVGNGDQD
jgi:hypothetical protein